jgi:hypothetical protein
VLLLLSCSSCGGGSTNSGEPSSAITSVSVTPASTNVQLGAQQQFTADISGTGSFSAAVNWSVSGNSDDQNLGTISNSGLYTAAANPPNPNTVTIKATSVLDPSKSGIANVVIGSSPFQITGVTISPTTPNVNTAQTQQFAVAVEGTGSFSNAIVWLVDGGTGGDFAIGTISSSGLYTAPQTVPGNGIVTITATSAVDPTLSATAQVTLTQGPPIVTQISPPSANATDTIQIDGTGLGGAPGLTATVLFPGPNGIQLAVPANLSTSSPTQLTSIVPLSTVSGQVFVQVQEADGSIQLSNGTSFTRLPRVRIRAAQEDLSEGESTSFQSRILGLNTAETLNWSVDVGSVNSAGIYTATGNLTSDSFAVVTACVQGTQICDQQRLQLHPFRISPSVPIVGLGNAIQLSGIQAGSSVSPVWQLDGPGVLSSNGDYTASSQITNGGGVPVTATFNGDSEQVSLSVTGGFPGIVNRVADYIDFTQQELPLGTFAANVGISGNQAYVEASDYWDGNTPTYNWVDVYDISNPTQPIWTDAFEPAALGQLVACDGFLYQITGQDQTLGPPLPGVIAVYDVSGLHPVLLSRQISPVDTPVITSQNGCLFTEISLSAWSAVSADGAPVVIDQLNLQMGSVTHTQYSLTLPNSISPPSVGGFASDGRYLYLLANTTLLTYDLTTFPPSQVGLIQVGNGVFSSPTIVENLLFLPEANFEEPTSQVFDISTPQPVLLTQLNIGSVLSWSGSTLIADSGTGASGIAVVDISSQQPKVVGTSFDYVDSQYTATLDGSYMFSTEGEGGLAIYDVSEPGGLLASYLATPNVAVPASPVFAQTANSENLYFAVANAAVDGGGVLDYDLSTTPPSPVGGFSTGSSLCQALAISGSYLYTGTIDSLRVLDVSNPASPTQVDSLAGGISALATTGNTLFAGTVNNQLVVYSLSQPSSPTKQATLSLPGLPIEFAVSGNLLLIADSTGGLLIYNIATPNAPVLLSQTLPSTSVTDVAVDGNLALLAAWEAGLVITDITNPATPQIIAKAALDTIDPYAAFQSYLLNKAATITVLNKVAFIGVYNADTSDPPNNGNGIIYGFDYSLSTTPRLVSLQANGITADAILTIRTVGGRLFAGGTSDIIDFDTSQPRDTINLFFPPNALRPPPRLSPSNRGFVSRNRMPAKHNTLNEKNPVKRPMWRKYR